LQEAQEKSCHRHPQTQYKANAEPVHLKETDIKKDHASNRLGFR